GTTNAYWPGSGTTVFFKRSAAGGFTIAASGANDPESNPVSYNYGSLTGFANANGAYTFDASSTTQTGTITAANAGGLTDSTTPPCPTRRSSDLGTTNAYWPGSGTTVYFQRGAAGGFTLSATGSSDGESGLQGYTYGALTGFSNTGGAYTFDASSVTQSASIT